jgi:glycosyltransferase involved in cell wall biosynthesis
MRESIVAIGIIVWNGEKSISQTLNSLLDQTYKNIRIYILDNQSTDQTLRILQEYAIKDSRVQYCIDEKKRDIAAAQKVVFDRFLVNYEYCMFSCDDDLYDHRFVEKLMLRLSSRSDVSLVYSKYQVFNGSNNISDVKNYPIYTENNSPLLNARNFLIFRNCIPLFFGIYKVDSLLTSMAYFKMVDKYGFNHENLMLLHFLINNQVDCIPEFYFFYRDKERIELYKNRGYKFSTLGIKKYYYSLIHNFHFTVAIYKIFSETKIPLAQRILLYILLPLTYIHRTIYALLIYPAVRQIVIFIKK